MLERIIDLSVRYRVLVLVAFATIAALGVLAWKRIPLDAFPDVTPVQVTIYTEVPGGAAEDVERLVTFPIEAAVAGLPRVQQVRSFSLFGLSYVTVYFEDGVNVYFARQVVTERLLEAKERIPEGFGTPVLGPNSSGLGQVFWYAVRSTDPAMPSTEVRALHDWTVRLIMRTAPGVDDVLSWGGHQKQFQVLVDPARLVKYSLELGELLAVMAGSNRQVSGQSVTIGREQYAVRGLGLVRSTDDIARTVLAERAGVPITVGDVAQVIEGPGLRYGAVTRDGGEVVLGMALQRIGSNAEGVVRALKQRLEVVKRVLPASVKLDIVYDRTEIIDKAISMADTAMIEGVVLVVAVLFLFIGEVRAALVVVVAIPMARLIAFLFMERWGLSANLLSLGGLVIGLGMTVDGPIVLIENAARRLAHGASGTADRIRIVTEAAKEVINPIAFGVLIIAVVFIPLLSLEGLEGRLFKPLALNMVFAMIGSIVLTVLLMPVLASLVLRPREEKDPWIMRRAKSLYAPLLEWSLRYPRRLLASAVVALAAALATVPFLGKEFMPILIEQEVMFRITGIPAVSLDESVQVSRTVDQTLKRFPQTLHTTATIGRAERGETADVNYMEVLVELKPHDEWPKSITYSELSREMGEALEAALPTSVVNATQPVQMRVDELISGVRSPLALKIYGEDLGTLERLSQAAKRIVESTPGAVDVSLEANRGKPQLVVRVDREAAGRYGISVEEVLEAVRTGIGGRAVSQVLDGVKRFDLVVWTGQDQRSSAEAIRSMPLRSADGALVPLSRVARIDTAEGYSFVRREQLQRFAIVQLGVEGRDIDGFVTEAASRLEKEIKLPEGYWLDWGGAFENQRRAMARLAVIVPLTIGLIFLLLYTAFGNVRHATLILANIPFATVGGVFALFVSGQYLSVPAAVGFIAVFGVAVLNGIVLIKFFNDLRAEGKPLDEVLREGALLRLRPVLMTALVEILGLVPFLLATGVGSEILRPLATVVIGGLLSATVLTLLLLPAMYEWIEARNQESGASKQTASPIRSATAGEQKDG
ncbi:MAG: efflux RND transporter permease subunit [Burkholderiales bacterium]|nr:efflux RND transporter permease subunit [Burkholderiales bacterium]